MTDRIDLLLPTRDRRSALRILLKRLLAQTDRDWNLILVEDGAEGRPVLEQMRGELESAGHRLAVVEGPRRGPAAASAAGVPLLSAPLVMRLDDDLRPEPDFLARLRALLLRAEDIGAVAGHYPNPQTLKEHGFPDANNILKLRAFGGKLVRGPDGYLPMQRQTVPALADDEPYEVDHIYSAWLGRREAFERAGGFAVEYEGPGLREETDLSLRLRMAGYRLMIDPRAVAWHHHGEAGGTRALAPPERERMGAANDRLFHERAEAWRKAGKLPFLVDLTRR